MNCEKCKQPMVFREDQYKLGEWFDCINQNCRLSSVFIPNEEFIRLYGEPGSQKEKVWTKKN